MVGRAQSLVLLAALLVLGSAIIGGAAAAPREIGRLDQGWGTAQEETFYYMPQGTVIMPVSWLAALNAADGQPLMSPERMRRLGFLVDDHATTANPNHWPIGFAINSGAKTGGFPTVGLTCAACHTSELTYRGKTVRVDGGQANIDLDGFKKLVTDAILTTGANPTHRAKFEQRAVALGFPKEKMDPAFEARYQSIRQGAARLTAYAAQATRAGPGRNDALAAIALTLFNYDLGVPTNTNRATAPVDYPPLWNIANLYWVQYNGAVHQPMSRNIGEALGVGALTNFVDPATGKLNPEPDRWRTSIPVANLYAIETLVESLKPPAWPAQTFGAIDRSKAARGRELFAQNCASCHAVRVLAGSTGAWSVKVLPLHAIGTDPRQAENFAKDTYDGMKLCLSTHATGGAGLKVVTGAIRTQAYKDDGIAESQWAAYDGFGRKNVLTEPCGYKARPLVGIWSTPPFLHNGSVPSIFALLSESRPATFRVGASEFDPKHLGFVEASGPAAMTIGHIDRREQQRRTLVHERPYARRADRTRLQRCGKVRPHRVLEERVVRRLSPYDRAAPRPRTLRRPRHGQPRREILSVVARRLPVRRAEALRE